jgi:hypothetical protein
MGLGKGLWPSLWFLQGVLEVVFIPGSALAWVFLAVATVYWLMKLMRDMLPAYVGHLLTLLTGMLWIVSSLFLF